MRDDVVAAMLLPLTFSGYNKWFGGLGIGPWRGAEKRGKKGNSGKHTERPTASQKLREITLQIPREKL